MAERFPITLYTFERNAEKFVFDADISAETLKILNGIYRKTEDICQSGYDSAKLENSVFGCFFKEGFFVYSFFDINSHGMMSMKGLFIPEKYRRTAWRIYLRNIMCMAAADEFKNTQKTIYNADYDFMCSISEDAERRLDVEYYLKINKYFTDMNKSIPHNFALTDYPIRKLPIVFSAENSDYDSLPDDYEDGKISLNPLVVDDAFKKFCEEEKYLKDIYILRTSKKNFLEIKKDELREKGIKKAYIKSEIDDLEYKFKSILSDSVWYIINDSSKYIQCLDPITIKDLESGCIDFATLDTAVKNACSIAESGKNLRDESVQNTDDRKKGGLFGQIFRKK